MSIMVSSDSEPQALATTRSRDSAPMALKRQMAMLCTRKSISQYTKNLQAQPGRRFSAAWLCCSVSPFCMVILENDVAWSAMMCFQCTVSLSSTVSACDLDSAC